MRDVQDNAEQIAYYAHWIELPAHVGELMQGWVNEARRTSSYWLIREANRSDIEQGEKAQKRLIPRKSKGSWGRKTQCRRTHSRTREGGDTG